MKNALLVLVGLAFLTACDGNARYDEKTDCSGTQKTLRIVVFKHCMDGMTGGDTEAEDGVSECVDAAEELVVCEAIPGFRYYSEHTPVSPWRPCTEAALDNEKRACQYVRASDEVREADVVPTE